MLLALLGLCAGCNDAPKGRVASTEKKAKSTPDGTDRTKKKSVHEQTVESTLPKRSPFADVAVSPGKESDSQTHERQDSAEAGKVDDGQSSSDAAVEKTETKAEGSVADSEVSTAIEPTETAPLPRADAKNEDGTYGKDHVDPVKLNGPIFEKWPKPKAAILFSGAQDGYIEPCGCAGLENQKGGLSRRHQLIKKLKADGWPLAEFDAGGVVKRYGPQQALKFAASIEALKTIGYDAIGFGGDDLRLPIDELLSAVATVDEKPSPFVATNIVFSNFEDNLARHKIVKVADLRIGVLAVVGEEEQRKVNNPEIHFTPAGEAIAKALPNLQQENCDKLILLAHTTSKEAEELAKRFEDFDYIVNTAGAEEPPAQPKRVGRKTQLIEVGHKGMYCVVIGLYDEPRAHERYQRVPLDARFGESAEMQQIMVSYQDQLKDLGLTGLGVVPLSGLPKHPKNQQFIGSAACGECHTKAYAIWKETPHAHATDSIVELSPPRHFDPECLSCHVTGWDPQGYRPLASGFLDLKQKHLHSNGCENCHGPGSRHAAAQAGEIDVTDQELKNLQRSMRVTVEQAKENLCVKCHDLDNSPEYNWDTYWPQVEHKGKD
jgi:hypothetical protein